MKRKRKKARKKAQRVRSYLEAVNFHCANVTTALRNLADTLDNVRSFHLDKEKPS